jgi:hypothetical protein
MVKKEETEKKVDTYTIGFSDVDIGDKSGRYQSMYGPKSAAQKAAQRIFRNYEEARKKGTIQIGMRKTTKGDKNRGMTYVYKATRYPFDEPKTIRINGKEIESRYYVEMEEVRKDEPIKRAQS